MKNKIVLAVIAFIVIAGIVIFFIPSEKQPAPVAKAKQTDLSLSTNKDNNSRAKTIPVFNINTAKITNSQKIAIQNIAKTLIAENKKLSEKVLQAKAEAGAVELLSFKRIKNDQNLKGTAKILNGMRTAIRAYYNNTVKAFLNIQKTVQNLDISEDTKNWILLGMKNGLDAINITSSGDLLILDQSEHIIKMLNSKKEEWTAENGKVTFNNKTDQKKFDKYIEKIQQLKNTQTKQIAPKVHNYKVVLKSLGV